jgi:hypothetical protein
MAFAALLVFACAPLQAQTVIGRVVDSGSGAAVPLAQVVVTGGGGASERRARSGADGRFTLTLSGGTYRLQVTRLGYQDARPRTFTLGDGDTVRIAVPLSAAALPLAPVSATAKPRRLQVDGVFQQLRADSQTVLVPARARSAWGGIEVRGTFPTPSDCFQLASAAHRERSVLTLIVEARPADPPCMDLGGLFSYKATVRGVRPGTYTLRVLHAYREDVWESALALDTTVTVR